MTKKSKDKMNKMKSAKRLKIVSFIVSFGLIGGIFIYLALAATYAKIIEPEEGTTNSQVSLVNDGTAAGGKYVQFNNPVVTPPNPPPNNTGSLLPAQFVGGYLEGWRGVYPSDIPSNYNVIYHAFGIINYDGSINILTPSDRQRLANEYKARKAQGKPTILSVGGAGGANAGMSNSSQIQNFINSIVPIIDEFGFSGIDWDLELNVPGGISPSGIVDASRQLKSRYGSSFIITMAPFEGIEAPYKEIARQLGSDLTSVGYQFYNMDARVSTAVVNAHIQEWINDTGISASQFSVGLWYGPDDWHQYTIPETELANIYRGVKAVYPNVRGTWTWGINTTDAPRGYAFANNMPGAVY